MINLKCDDGGSACAELLIAVTPVLQIHLPLCVSFPPTFSTPPEDHPRDTHGLKTAGREVPMIQCRLTFQSLENRRERGHHDHVI